MNKVLKTLEEKTINNTQNLSKILVAVYILTFWLILRIE